MKVIGVTGSIGTGKSTFVKLISSKYSIPIIDADEIVKAAHKRKDVIKNIKLCFGEDFYDKDDNLDKKKIAQIVFTDEEKRKILNNILHPIVKDEYKNKVYSADKNAPFIIYDCPLLIEENLTNDVDLSILIYATEDTQLERVTSRDNINIDDAKKRISSQMKISDKIKYCDIVVFNDGDISSLENNIPFVYNTILEKIGNL